MKRFAKHGVHLSSANVIVCVGVAEGWARDRFVGSVVIVFYN